MGRHHSFLDSLKNIGHTVEHTFNSQPPILKAIEKSALSANPVGIIASIAISDPSIGKAIIGAVQKAAPSVESALKTVGHEAISTIKTAEHQSAQLRGSIVKFGGSALNSVEHFGSNLLGDLKYIPFIIGGIAVIWVYSKVK